MALTAEEQELLDAAKAILPSWFFADQRLLEDLAMAAKELGAARTVVQHWLGTQTKISTAVGATATEPDWLDQHARDRGSSRQSGETDAALRSRLQTLVDDDGDALAVTRAALMDAVASILTAYAVAGTAAMVEMSRDQAFFSGWTGNAGVGGTFTAPDSSGFQTFTPTVKFAYPPFTTASGRIHSHQLVISGAASGGNNGTFVTTGLVNNAAKYSNAAGVVGADATVVWSTRRRDVFAVSVEGRRDAFLSRGYRMGRSRGGGIIVILPFGTSEPARKSVFELLRARKGGGISLVVERRQVP